MSRLSDEDLRAAYYCAGEVLRGRRLRGQPIPAWLRTLFDHLDSEVRASHTRQQSRSDETQLKSDDWIGSGQAAVILGWSQRRVQRRAADLDGRSIGGRLAFREAVVVEYAEGRRFRD